MIDINLIRENPEKVRNALLKRMVDVDFTQLWNGIRNAGDSLRKLKR